MVSKKRHIIYILGFLLGLHSALPAYVNSTFIGTFASERLVGLVFTAAAILSILLFAEMPRILTRFGNFITTIAFLLASSVLIILFVTTGSGLILVPTMILYLALLRMIFLNMDLMLENFSDDEHTGSIRGIYLTFTNVAWLIGPTLAGFILAGVHFGRLYSSALVLLLVSIPILALGFNHYHDPKYQHPPFFKTLRAIWGAGDIHKVFMTTFLLRFFFSWMVIYTPIYLNQHLGFDWQTIGYIFTIMLLPFSLLDYVLGRLADTKLGEKEIMIGGFFVLIVSTALLSFVTTPSFLYWAVLLFFTRVGAASIDIMNETYFFKKIDRSQSDLLGFFRMTDPLGYIVGPLLASLVLIFVDFRYLFLVLGILMISGLYYAFTLRDTR